MRYGVGGGGAQPFAIITVPSPCAVTIAFKPIAPAKMIMARDTTASFLDIYASGDGNIPKGTVTLMTGMSSSPRYGSVPYWYTPARPVPSPGFRLVRWGRSFTKLVHQHVENRV